MGKKMLIDAAHPEETRVVVVQENRVEEFDFESSTKSRVRGNIYLAKVTRIEPSLQAAFVDYGGNRHGFLAFNEIHPDYYQIPAADREALVESVPPPQIEDMDLDDGDEEPADVEKDIPETDDSSSVEAASENQDPAEDPVETKDSEDEADGENESESTELSADADPSETDDAEAEAKPEENGGRNDEDAPVDARRQRRQKLRSYKIQEVIKRRQIILVQVVKEERGNKGAALTTYLSLAGRYCVLMPNTGRGGGISRKITSITDRKRLKKIVESLELPDGMGLIIRTAGSKRNKTEIKRDYEYLMRLWENVRSLTLESIAPSLVYEEGNLVKRALRDLYSKDIDEVYVEGEETYKEAKAFMKMMMPSHAKNIKNYKENHSLFQRHQVERQLDQIYNPQVQLKSGGYLVINPTEALVSIDVNSGRATKERNVENTALQTNLEAAEEVARQCRLRDLAGLLVIDFIDMEENRNNRAVEKRLKDSMKQDRARIQIGRISNFGLLEMSRQRMRSTLLEGHATTCTNCNGTGMMRSTESTVLRILRAIEEQAMDGSSNQIKVTVSTETALYILNNKRRQLQSIEDRCNTTIDLETDGTFSPPQFEIARTTAKGGAPEKAESAINLETPFSKGDTGPMVDDEDSEDRPSNKDAKPKRRRRRRSRNKSDKSAQTTDDDAATATTDVDAEAEQKDEDSDKPDPRRRRRRGKRGGRRQSEKQTADQSSESPQADSDTEDTTQGTESRETSNGSGSEMPDHGHGDAKQSAAEANGDSKPSAPQTKSDDATKPEPEKAAQPDPVVSATQTASETSPKKPTRRGWWQRRSV